MWAISGTNGSSGFGSVSNEHIESKICTEQTIFALRNNFNKNTTLLISFKFINCHMTNFPWRPCHNHNKDLDSFDDNEWFIGWYWTSLTLKASSRIEVFPNTYKLNTNFIHNQYGTTSTISPPPPPPTLGFAGDQTISPSHKPVFSRLLGRRLVDKPGFDTSIGWYWVFLTPKANSRD